MVVIALTAVVLVLAATAARAEKDQASAKAAAKTVLARGARDLDARLYGRALAEFQEAYRIFPSPKIFFNIGLANVYLDRHGEALQAFETFLAAPTGSPEESIARAKTESEALRPKVAAVSVVCAQAGVELVIDGRPAGTTPLKGPLYLDPGQHQLQAKPREGAPLVRDFVVDAGTRPTLDVPGGGAAPVEGTSSPPHKPQAASSVPLLVRPAAPPSVPRPAPPASATRTAPAPPPFAGAGGAKGPASISPAPARAPVRPTIAPAAGR